MRGGGDYGRQTRAVQIGDLAYAQLPVHRRRVAAALEVIEQASQLGIIGISYSGGKDSTVLLDLVRRIIPSAPAAFFDSGCEYRETYEIVAAYGVEVYLPEKTLLEMCRIGGYWGYRTPSDPTAEFNFGAVLIDEPARRFARNHMLMVNALGLRGQESRARALNAARRGALYFVKGEKIWHLCPLARWTDADVWGYIGSRSLPYNRIYDRMADLDIPRREWRVSTLLGSTFATYGRYAYLKELDYDLWLQLLNEFPKLGLYV